MFPAIGIVIPISRLMRQKRAAAIVEFALLLPLLLTLLLAMLSYGEYFLLAHSMQAFANDGARATVAGLNRSEREAAATRQVSIEAAQLDTIEPNRVSIRVVEAADMIRVTVTLDASDVPLISHPIVPMPGTSIARSAVIERTDPG